MSVVVINADPSWRFTSLVRQHAADLKRWRPEIAFWQARAPDLPGERRSLWGDWPRQLLGSRAVVESELLALVREPRPTPLALLFVLPGPGSIDEATGLITRSVLTRLADELGRSRLRQSRVLRLGVFRARPVDRHGEPLAEPVALAYDLVADHLGENGLPKTARLLDNAWFLSPTVGRSQDGDFVALRLLAELLAESERSLDVVRPHGANRRFAVAWLRSPEREPHDTQPAAVRALYTQLIDELKNAAGADEEDESAAETFASLDREVGNLLADVGEGPPQAQDPPVSDALARAAATMGRPPRFYEQGLDDRLEAEARALVDQLAVELTARHEKLAAERRRLLRGRLQKERQVVERIQRLQANNLGQRSRALTRLKELRDRVAERSREIRAHLGQLRGTIIQTALPIDTDSGDAGAVLRRLDEYKALEQPVPAVRAAARGLARGGAFVLLGVAMLILSWGPPLLFHLGTVDANAMDGTSADLLVQFAHALPLTLGPDGLTVWPAAHLLYAGVTFFGGLLIIRAAIRQPHQKLVQELNHLLEKATVLHARAHGALDASLAYAERSYVLGWCALLDRRLQDLATELQKEQSFDEAFQDLQLQRIALVDRATLDEARRQFLPKLHERPRRHWLSLLLESWPQPAARKIEFEGESRLVADTTFLGPQWNPSDGELILDPLGLVTPERPADASAVR